MLKEAYELGVQKALEEITKLSQFGMGGIATEGPATSSTPLTGVPGGANAWGTKGPGKGSGVGGTRTFGDLFGG